MDRIALFIISVFCFIPFVFSKESNQLKTLAEQYSITVGDIELANAAFNQVNSRCKTDFEYTEHFKAETDYYLRKNTGYTFLEFVNFLNKEKKTNALAKRIIDGLIQEHGGCDTLVLSHWFKYIIKYSEDTHLSFLRKNKSIWVLPRIIREDEKIQQQFNRQLKNYRSLPYVELFDLALTLEHGSYRYSMYSFSQTIPIDKDKAIEIWRYAIKKYNKPQAYYYLAKLLQYQSTKDAFTAFKQSAELGYKYGEIWLGTYYACNNDTIKASYWLNKAKVNFKDPDYIDDIFAEIYDLGMPTNCIDGWAF